MPSTKIKKLFEQIKPLYARRSKEILFHGWHHILFVRNKALFFSKSVNANKLIVEAAALTHDINYIVKPNSEPEIGKKLRQKLLSKAGFTFEEKNMIEKVILEAHTRTRIRKISPEGMALSDADTLFKALPITPIVLAQKYLLQNKVDLLKLARKITAEQNPLMKKNIYFYTAYAKKEYLHWAKVNLMLWNNVVEALKDKDVRNILQIVNQLKINK
ncbi:MAG: HD domain-containing protein [Patescibacteria group bacterium]